ncbi:hypothetical protein M9Y10_031755 [Tritrichomonas musculus]|uniref:t-SNARE coiled-coil homology domain-containing protein n=1 Tax=Tritrichomonas musculus TaxID=1915356 RepID=A0ABR2H0L8_9EUKA
MNADASTIDSLQDLDKKIDSLVEIVQKQNILAQNISCKLNEDNILLNDINNHMDKAQNQVNNANSAVLEIRATKTQWIAWVLMIILIITNIGVWCFVNKR